MAILSALFVTSGLAGRLVPLIGRPVVVRGVIALLSVVSVGMWLVSLVSRENINWVGEGIGAVVVVVAVWIGYARLRERH